MFNNAKAGAACARAGGKTPSEAPRTALLKQARTNERHKTVVFILEGMRIEEPSEGPRNGRWSEILLDGFGHVFDGRENFWAGGTPN